VFVRLCVCVRLSSWQQLLTVVINFCAAAYAITAAQSDCCAPRDAQDISFPVKVLSLDMCKDMCTEGRCVSIQYLPDKRLCRLFTRPALLTTGQGQLCNCFARQDAPVGAGTRWFDASANQCRDLTVCAAGDRELSPPSPTSDRAYCL